MDISVVVPLLNEEESLPELTAWIDRVMKENHFTYEILLIDDGSTDNSWKVIDRLSAENKHIIGIKFRRNYGKSAALNEGFKYAQGRVVVTMDADLQDSPDEIPGLYKMITEENYDLVSGWKKKRYDPISKTVPTKLYNAATRSISGINTLHDFNCGLKAYKKEVVKSIEVYGEMHRYIPVIAAAAGFKRIGEKIVQHRPRQYGTTKFGYGRFLSGPLDLLSISFVSKFGKRPMHLFGTIGIVVFFLGALMALYLGIDKLYLERSGRLLTQRPVFYLALVTMIIGTQLFLTGFISELVSRNSPDRNKYLIEKILNKS